MFYEKKSPDFDDESGSCFETGNIRPPKGRHGMLAAVLLSFALVGALVGSLRGALERMRPNVPVSPDASQPVDRTPSQPTEPPKTTLPPATGNSTQLEISDVPSSVDHIPQTGGMALQDIYDKVAPSTVSVSATSGTETSCGTGIIMSAEGYIITNNHVIDRADSVSVTLYDGRVEDAALVGQDAPSDLAVLRIQAENLTPAEFGNSDQVRVGDAVSAIGDPLGQKLRGTLTEGIISAINRNLTIQGQAMTLIQTTAALNEGNSGGPLINCFGQVIGINTAKISSFYTQSSMEGLGFAIPINTAKEVVDQLIAYGRVPGRAVLDFELCELSDVARQLNGLPEGLYVTKAPIGSSAYQAGIQAGDVVMELDGAEVKTEDDLNMVLSAHKAGDTLQATVFRGGRLLEVEIMLTATE